MQLHEMHQRKSRRVLQRMFQKQWLLKYKHIWADLCAAQLACCCLAGGRGALAPVKYLRRIKESQNKSAKCGLLARMRKESYKGFQQCYPWALRVPSTRTQKLSIETWLCGLQCQAPVSAACIEAATCSAALHEACTQSLESAHEGRYVGSRLSLTVVSAVPRTAKCAPPCEAAPNRRSSTSTRS